MVGLQVLYHRGLELSGPISMSLEPSGFAQTWARLRWAGPGGSERPACLEGRAATGPGYRLGC